MKGNQISDVGQTCDDKKQDQENYSFVWLKGFQI